MSGFVPARAAFRALDGFPLRFNGPRMRFPPGLGKLVGVHWTTVSRWERETVTIPEPTAKLLRLLSASRTKKGG